MSFYEPQGWQAPVRQASWEQPPPPSRSGASSTSQREDTTAFATQFEEVDRAIDNLVKSGKIYGGNPRPLPSGGHRGDYGNRMHGGRHSVGDFDPSRPHSGANLQNFYASQRHQGRHNDAEQMLQAKRRMAAQRERELRNYHQEQQYNRSVLAEMPSAKSDRSMSPSTLSEEGRRDLIARQHRALYGNEGTGPTGQSPYGAEGVGAQDQTGAVPGSAGPQGSSQRGSDPFGGQGDAPGQGQGGPDTNRLEKTASPSAQPAPGFGSFEASMQSSGTNRSPSTGEDPSHARQISKSTTAPLSGGMGPIGSRPNTGTAPNQGLNKRTTSPLPSALGYAFGNNEPVTDRAPSSNSNTNPKESSGMGTWGTGSGVWGSNKIGTTSVWG